MSDDLEQPQHDTDVRAWVLIGMIVGVVALVLYVPLVWQVLHTL